MFRASGGGGAAYEVLTVLTIEVELSMGPFVEGRDSASVA